MLDLLKLLLNKSFEFKIRVLLLARDSGEWWSLLPIKDAYCQPFLDGNATTGPYGLSPLHLTAESRVQAYQTAMQTYAAKLNKQPVKAQPKLTDLLFEHPLYIQMAALLALFGEQPESAEGVARALVGHERRYWQQASDDDNSVLLMTLATLMDGISTTREVEPIWKKIGEERASLRTLFKTLTPLYPDTQGLSGLKPDLLGEALVAQLLLSEQGLEVINIILQFGTQKNRVACLTVLARILNSRNELEYRLQEPIRNNFIKSADTLVAVILEMPGPFSKLVENAFLQLKRKEKIQACGILDKHFGENRTIPLMDLQLMVREIQLEQCSNKQNLDSLHKRGSALYNLTISLRDQGLASKATDCSKEALEIAEKLANIKPSTISDSNLVKSLNTYVIALSDNCQFEESQIFAERLLVMTKRLAKSKPEHFEPLLATTLNTYAKRLCETGEYDNALKILKQAMEIREDLANHDPLTSKDKLANSIENYAACLCECGEPNKGLTIFKSALNIREELAEYEPEKFETDLADALQTYSVILGDVGNFNKALTISKKSLSIKIKLARSKPDIFEASLAMAHHNLANKLIDIGDYDKALHHINLALSTYKKLAELKPLNYQHDYHNTLITFYFISWLCGKTISFSSEIFDFKFVSFRKKSYIEFLISFLNTIFTQKIQINTHDKLWLKLDRIQKIGFQEYKLILAPLSEKRGVTLQLSNNWKNDLITFSQQREGNLPWWMLETARRLDVSLDID